MEYKIKGLSRIVKSDTFKSIAALFSSNIIVAVVGVLITVIQGRYVTPEDFGYFKQFSIVSGYIVWKEMEFV